MDDECLQTSKLMYTSHFKETTLGNNIAMNDENK